MNSSLPALPGAGSRPFIHLLRVVPDIYEMGIAMFVHLNKISQQNRLLRPNLSPHTTYPHSRIGAPS
jgi:hypothetical protein